MGCVAFLQYLVLGVVFVWSYTPKRLTATKPLSPANAPPTTPSNDKVWVDKWGIPIGSVDTSSVKIVTYNVLGPVHGESSKHDYASESVTRWTRRRDKLLDELRAMKADILCLQEVSAKGLKESFIPGLRRIGCVFSWQAYCCRPH